MSRRRFGFRLKVGNEQTQCARKANLSPEYTRAEPPKKPQGVNKSQFEAKQTPGQTGITRAEIRNPNSELRKKAILALPGRATGRTQHGLQMPDADSARDPAGAGAVCADKCGGERIKVYISIYARYNRDVDFLKCFLLSILCIMGNIESR